MEDLIIPTKKVMNELIKSKVQTYVNSKQGKLEISNAFKGELAIYLNDSSWRSEFYDLVQQYVKKIVNEKYSEEDMSRGEGAEIFELGLIKWLSLRGYEIKRKDK